MRKGHEGDYRRLLCRCVQLSETEGNLTAEWIKLISAQSNTVCEESSKKTISPEHVLEALKVGTSFTYDTHALNMNSEGGAAGWTAWRGGICATALIAQRGLGGP